MIASNPGATLRGLARGVTGTNDGTIAAKRRNRCEDGSDFNEPGGLDRVRGRR